ncbi:MAG: hypothetical protein HKO03_01725 [Acidimicrobiia bacterium]|nr:hypothetical protein [Acidimicrobiia bacterium]
MDFPITMLLSQREWQIISNHLAATWNTLDRLRMDTPYPADQAILDQQNEISNLQARWRDLHEYLVI